MAQHATEKEVMAYCAQIAAIVATEIMVRGEDETLALDAVHSTLRRCLHVALPAVREQLRKKGN